MYLFAYFLLWRSVQPELVYPHRWSHTNVNGASPPPTVSSWLLLQKTSSKSAFWPTLETALCGSFFDFQPKIQRIRPFLNLFLIYCTYFKYFFFFFVILLSMNLPPIDFLLSYNPFTILNFCKKRKSLTEMISLY